MARDDTRDEVTERLDELTKEAGGKAGKAATPVVEDFAATPVGRGDASRSGSRTAAGTGSARSSDATPEGSSGTPKGPGGGAKSATGGARGSDASAKRAGSGASASAGADAAGDLEASERALDEGWSDLAPVAEGGDGPSAGLLSFYDRLRARILAAVERRGGKLGPATVRSLLLVPDVFILLVRLTFDREVPASARAMIGGALAYFILPMDLFPEAMFGAAGYVDDLVLATAVLAHAFGGELEPYARKHWSGPEDVRKVLADVSGAAQGLLGENLYERLQGLLRKRGIDVDSAR